MSVEVGTRPAQGVQFFSKKFLSGLLLSLFFEYVSPPCGCWNFLPPFLPPL